MPNQKCWRRHPAWIGFGISTAAFACALPGSAQVVERHSPTVPESTTAPIGPSQLPDASNDATPLGPILTSIVLSRTATAPEAMGGQTLEVRDLPRLQGHGVRLSSRLAAFVHQPISRKLISQIEATIVKEYRRLGYPFVSVTAPPQDISNGALRFQIIEFSVGKIRENPDTASFDTEIASQVRLKSADEISARLLTNDLSWVNRYPFSQVQPVFAPGSAPETTDVSFNESRGKPWQVYAGYNNSGSEDTGFDRYFAGGSVGNLLGYHSVLSFQGTGASDAIANKGRLFSFDSHPVYESRALNYTLPIFTRGQIEASLDQVESNANSNPFSTRLDTIEGTLGYRFSVSDLYGDRGLTDFRFGLEARHQTSNTLFGGASAYLDSLDIYQVYLGYHHSAQEVWGTSDLDLLAHLSPGGVTAANSDAQAVLYSKGRLTRMTYGYVDLNYNRDMVLPANWDLRA